MGASEFHVTGRVKRVGNSIALFIPAAAARKAGLKDGQTVDAAIRTDVPEAFGLLKDLPYERFDRRKDGMWRDRI